MANLTSIVGQEINEKKIRKTNFVRKLTRATKTARADRREQIELGIIQHSCGWPEFAWGTAKLLIAPLILTAPTPTSSSKR